MSNQYESIKKILDIKERRSDKALREKNNIQKKLDQKKENIKLLEQQLIKHKNFTEDKTNSIWGNMVGKNISIRDVDIAKREVAQLKEQTILIEKEIEEEQDSLKNIEKELEAAKKNHLEKVFEAERFKKTCEEFRKEHIMELQKKEDEEEADQ